MNLIQKEIEITKYSFGSICLNLKNIKISNTTYNKDIIILSNMIVHPWIRKNGHLLLMEDILKYVNKDILIKQEVIIVGKGYFNRMRVDSSVKKFCQENNIELIEVKSTKAVKIFNSTIEQKMLLIHLTC